jgi:hypothetical protein
VPNRRDVEPTGAQLEAAAHHVVYEWKSLVQMAAYLSNIQGSRDLLENALLEACLVHNRNLIEFLCGSERTGSRNPETIQPSDFLGHSWWPEDVEFDCRLRGRLYVMHENLAHISWQRVLDKEPVLWPAGFLAWETSWGMKCFAEAAEAEHAACWEIFATGHAEVRQMLPPYDNKKPQTVVTPAPHRHITVALRMMVLMTGQAVPQDWYD